MSVAATTKLTKCSRNVRPKNVMQGVNFCEVIGYKTLASEVLDVCFEH